MYIWENNENKHMLFQFIHTTVLEGNYNYYIYRWENKQTVTEPGLKIRPSLMLVSYHRLSEDSTEPSLSAVCVPTVSFPSWFYSWQFCFVTQKNFIFLGECDFLSLCLSWFLFMHMKAYSMLRLAKYSSIYSSGCLPVLFYLVH